MAFLSFLKQLDFETVEIFECGEYIGLYYDIIFLSAERSQEMKGLKGDDDTGSFKERK